MSLKKPTTVPWKIASIEIQEKYIHKIENLKKNADNSNGVLLFCDASHIIHNTNVKSLWQCKWEKYTLRLQANTGRQRRNVLWCLSIWVVKLFCKVFWGSCNEESFTEYLYELRSFYKDKSKIDIILDNARYQKTKIVRETAKLLWIRLHYLPSYTPNLNIIEQIRKWLKGKLSNLYHEHSLDLYETICEYIRKANGELLWEIESISKRKIRIINAI